MLRELKQSTGAGAARVNLERQLAGRQRAGFSLIAVVPVVIDHARQPVAPYNPNRAFRPDKDTQLVERAIAGLPGTITGHI